MDKGTTTNIAQQRIPIRKKTSLFHTHTQNTIGLGNEAFSRFESSVHSCSLYANIVPSEQVVSMFYIFSIFSNFLSHLIETQAS